MVSSAPLRTVGNLNKYKLQISPYNAISTVFVETLSSSSVIYTYKKNLKFVVNSRLDFAWVCMKILIYNVYIHIYIYIFNNTFYVPFINYYCTGDFVNVIYIYIPRIYVHLYIYTSYICSFIYIYLVYMFIYIYTSYICSFIYIYIPRIYVHLYIYLVYMFI